MERGPLFWIGNKVAANLLDYASGKTFAVINNQGKSFVVTMYLPRIARFRFWRNLTGTERQGVVRTFFTTGFSVEFNDMRDAIEEIDALLVELRVICPLEQNTGRFLFAHC